LASKEGVLARSLSFEGRSVPFDDGDTVASALFRAGVRTFSRSFKYHRRRGLYCLSGDCPNCLVSVNSEPYQHACRIPAEDGMQVERVAGWPSADFDLLRTADRLHRLLPVGFYYKTFIRPANAWRMAEPVLRKLAGRGKAPLHLAPARLPSENVHTDVLVVGAGVAGAAAAAASADAGMSVVVCDEGSIPSRLSDDHRVKAIERAAAVGIYEGPLVPVAARDRLYLVHPRQIVVATGAVEVHPLFPGNDIPGVWLGRGAARLAATHGLAPGRVAVVAGSTHEVPDHVRSLLAVGVEVAAALVPEALMDDLPEGIPTFTDAVVESAEGRKRLRRVTLLHRGRRQTVACDTLVVSLGLTPRDGLLRQGEGQPVFACGDVVLLGCTEAEAEESGRCASLGLAQQAAEPPAAACPSGLACLCEDVSVDDLGTAWDEGFRSTELLKRYTTMTMGPCQGALCHGHLRAFVAERDPSVASGPTTARPPARTLTLEQAAAAAERDVEARTALHPEHLALGARMERFGRWSRPAHYGDKLAEYWAVRRGVSVMDVGTLGKFLVGGRDAHAFLDRIYPFKLDRVQPGRTRYALLLNEAGFVIDDGLVCRLDDNRFYVTCSTGGTDHAEAWFRDWAETWRMRVHLVNETASTGAINVAGPRSRELLGRLTRQRLDNAALPYMAHVECDVARVACRAIRLGFVGDLSYELHHPSSRSRELWQALLAAGDDLGVRPHGIDALDILRLEKGHVVVGKDTEPDSTPESVQLGWMAALDKASFVGKDGLALAQELSPRRRFVALRFDDGAPAEGALVTLEDGRPVGALTSAAYSPVLERGVGLAWIDRVDGGFPTALVADGFRGSVVEHAFYDETGERLRV
jgi:sarcosine oxidase subunit alpha